MKVLQINEKFSIEYDPDNNDLPENILRYGEFHSKWPLNNLMLAMFYNILGDESP